MKDMKDQKLYDAIKIVVTSVDYGLDWNENIRDIVGSAACYIGTTLRFDSNQTKIEFMENEKQFNHWLDE